LNDKENKKRDKIQIKIDQKISKKNSWLKDKKIIAVETIEENKDVLDIDRKATLKEIA